MPTMDTPNALAEEAAPTFKPGITPHFETNDENNAEIMCVRFSPDDEYIAASCSNGTIRIYNTQSGRIESLIHDGTSKMPISQLRWRPHTTLSKTKHVLVSTSTENNGLIQHWHVKSGKSLNTIQIKDCQLFCLDYHTNASQFAVTGEDRQVRIYDEATKREIQTLDGGDSVNTAGHSNRVFSIKYHPTDHNLILTAGWDNTVQFWDTRKGHSVQSIYGIHMCGDGLDISQDGTRMLTASWRLGKEISKEDNPLQIFDIRKLPNTDMKPPRIDIPWDAKGRGQSMLFAAQFSRDPASKYFVAGGSKSNEAKVFMRSPSNADQYEPFGAVVGLPHPVFTVDFSNNGKKVALGSGCRLRVLNITEEGGVN